MGPIEGGIALSPLTLDDIDDGLALVAEAGWNQTADDWRYLLSAGHGVGVRDAAGKVIATSTVLPYRPGIGWIGMVLVAGSHRKRGIATRLLREAIDWCKAEGLVPALDATPAGREVYRRLGFADGEAVERWRGNGRGAAKASGAIDLDLASRADRAAFGADRAGLLADLANRAGSPRIQIQDGLLLGRRGRTATQLGPLLSPDPSIAVQLLDAAIDTLGGPLLIDVPAREAMLRDKLNARGFTVERSFTRMSLDTPAPMGETMRAIAGPELG